MDPLTQVKESTKRMWSLGEYPEMAKMLAPAADALAAACGVAAGKEVLDVAAGNGNFAIAAAKRGARVTASDLTPQMLEWGRARSESEGLDIEWREADVEALPFEDDRFDVVASTFGASFAPRPERVASELFRVARGGGRVGMANWTNEGFYARFDEIASRFLPPSQRELPSSLLWGDRDEVHRRFKGLASTLEMQLQTLTFPFASPEEGRDWFERFNGPLLALKATLPQRQYRELMEEVRRMVENLNRATDGRLTIPAEYLLVVATKRV